MHDGSRLSDPQWTHLLDLGRRLLWSLFQDNQRGMDHKTSGLVPLLERIVDLLRWMAQNEYIAFSEIDAAAARSYCDHLLDRHTSKPISAHTLALKIDILCRIHEQFNVFADFSAAQMPQHPFGGRSATDVASTLLDPTYEHIPPVPEALFLAILAEALQWIDAPARDIARLVDLAIEERSLTSGSNSYSYKLNLALQSFVFDDGGELPRPWRPSLSDSYTVRRWRPEHDACRARTVTPMLQVRHLATSLEAACAIVIQALLGLRISELAGLQALPLDPTTGWPSCLDVRPSRTGLNEIFFVKGHLFKTERTLADAEWVAGSRPAGTDYLPPPVRAILALTRLFAPLRKRFGRSELIVGLGSARGLPRRVQELGPILSDTLRRHQKSFVKEHVAAPAPYQDWELTPHQWRKSFALYMVRSDERLLSAVSDHFKHMSLAMTEQGYVGSDTELLGLMDDVATREAAKVLLNAAGGNTSVSGRMADVITQNAAAIRALVGESGSEADCLERLTQTLKNDNVRVWSAPWGKCMFRPEAARCRHDEHGDFNLAARAPSYAHRRPGVCCGCSNLLVTPDEHTGFWKERHSKNVELYHANVAAGDRHAAAVAAARARTSASILRKMGVEVRTPQAMEVDHVDNS